MSKRDSFLLSPLLSLLCVLGAVTTANAAEGAPLLGDWGGRRSGLEQRGITFNVLYNSEDVHNLKGGSAERTVHAGQFAAGADIDLDKLWGWDGWRAGVAVSHRDGDNLNDKAGLNELLQSQEIYGRGKIWRLGGLWVSKRFDDGRFGIKAGRLAVGDDFNSLDCMAASLTFCGSQPAMFLGDYWMNGPLSQWGVVLDVRPAADVYLRAGAYQVNPSYTETSGGGWRLAPSGTTGTLTPVELGWNPAFGGLGGHYAIGGWYSSAPREDAYRDVLGGSAGLSGLDPAMRTGAYGGYLSAHQQFTRGHGGDPRSGLRGYFDVAQADRRTSAIDRTLHLIAIYTGPSASRPHDSIGLGIGATHVNPRYSNHLRDENLGGLQGPVTLQRGNEYTAELFYAWHAISGVRLQPLLQYVVRPGGNSGNPDVLVVGMRTVLSF